MASNEHMRGERRESRMDQEASTETSDRRERYRDDERRVEQYRDQREQRPSWGEGRLRNRLARDLDLSDDEVNELISTLEHHRELGKELFMKHREAFRGELAQLQEQLENDLSEILTAEQMQIWHEEYAPDVGRLHRRQSGERER